MTATEHLRHLLAVEAAATPGPWDWASHRGIPALLGRDGSDEFYDCDEEVLEVIHNDSCPCRLEVEIEEYDKALIVAARNHLQPLAQALVDVLELHQSLTVFYYGDGPMGSQECRTCHQPPPCPTVQAIIKHLEGDE